MRPRQSKRRYLRQPHRHRAAMWAQRLDARSFQTFWKWHSQLRSQHPAHGYNGAKFIIRYDEV
jgi:hypothetical protein